MKPAPSTPESRLDACSHSFTRSEESGILKLLNAFGLQPEAVQDVCRQLEELGKLFTTAEARDASQRLNAIARRADT